MLKTFTKGEKNFFEGFKNEVFPFYYDENYEYQMKAEREVEKEIRKKKRRRKRKKENQKQKQKKNKRKNKKKSQKKTNFSNILRINEKVSAMICLESILILKHLLS